MDLTSASFAPAAAGPGLTRIRASVRQGEIRQARAASQRRTVRARYDAQFTSDENRRHWALADAASADAEASPGVRHILRMRATYEYQNNSYAKGISHTVGHYVIGTGPQLQLQTKNKQFNAFVEALFRAWALEVGLAQKLWQSRVARMYRGEAFMIMQYNPGLDGPVKLDLRLLEADQVQSPLFGMYPQQFPDQWFDGIVLDRYGNRAEYHVLKQHPGAMGAFVGLSSAFDRIPARYVLHDYRVDRPGQQRAVPELTPALPLFALNRRFTLAVLGAAEVAARHPLVIKTTAADVDAPDAQDVDDQGNLIGPPVPMDVIDLAGMAATVLPDGYDLQGMKAEQPTTTFDAFSYAIIREACRCIGVPAFFGMLDAEKTNMSSAYVISQPFIKCVLVDRAGYERHLGRIFDEFLTEALRVPGLVPFSADEVPADLPRSWRWPSVGNHADPMKVAAAEAQELSSGSTNLPRVYAKHGLDWEEELENGAKAYGITVPQYQALLRQKTFGPAVGNGPAAGNSAGNSPAGQQQQQQPPADEDDAPDGGEDDDVISDD